MKKFFKRNPGNPPNIRQRIVSMILAVVLAVTAAATAIPPREEVYAADGEMVLSDQCVVKWSTTTTGNKLRGKHFRTVGWTFFLYKGRTANASKLKQTLYVPITGKNNGVTQNDSSDLTMRYNLSFYDLGSGNSSLNRKARDFYDTIEDILDDSSSTKEEQPFSIYANPTVEFYDNSGSTEKVYKSVTTKAEADSYAHTFFGNSKSYFDNYFNKRVKIISNRLKVTAAKDSETGKMGVDTSTITIGGENKKVQWTSIPQSYKIGAKTKDGYLTKAVKRVDEGTSRAMLSAPKASAKTYDRNVKNFESATVSKNLTYEISTVPVSIRLHFIKVDENKEEQEVYVTTDKKNPIYDMESTFFSFTSNATLKEIATNTKYSDWKDKKSGKTYAKSATIGNADIWTLYKSNGGVSASGNAQIHDVYLVSTYDGIIGEDDSDSVKNPDYSVIYKGNKNTDGKSSVTQKAVYGSSIQIKSNPFKRTGYHTNDSDTWLAQKDKATTFSTAQKVTDKTFSKAKVFDDDKKTKVTLLANWKANKCTISYNGNGNTSGTVASQTITYDKWTTEVAKNTFKKTGDKPTGEWNTKPDGSGISIPAGTVITEKWYTRLFGEGANGKKITLYAIWESGESEDNETYDDTATPLSGGNLIYVNTLDSDTDGPYPYSISGNVILKEAMFGEKYEENKTEIFTYDAGLCGAKEEMDYLVKAGSTVYKFGENYYVFKGWSVDPYATWENSQQVLWYENQNVSGRDLALRYYGYLHPVKPNPSWAGTEFEQIDEPLREIMSITDLRARASEIITSQNAWGTYLELLQATIDKQTALRDEEKELWYENRDLRKEWEAVKKSLQSQKPSSSDYTYTTSTWHAPVTDKDGNITEEGYYTYDTAIDWSEYNSALAAWNAKMNEANANITKYKTLEEKHKALHIKAKEFAAKAVTQLSGINQSINLAIGATKVMAVWDQFPVFVGMDEIGINEDKIDKVTPEWLFEHVTVADREDGTLDNGTDVEIENYDTLQNELHKLQNTGSVSVTFRATDSAGNVTRYTINIWVNANHELQKPDLSDRLYYETGGTRFINRKSYEIGNPDNYANEQDYLARYANATGIHINEDGTRTTVPYYLYVGGLHPDSKWYRDPFHKAEIENAFANQENGTPEEVWSFSHQDILDMQAFVDEHGIGDTYGKGNLKLFFDTFKRCRTVYKEPFQDTYGK